MSKGLQYECRGELAVTSKHLYFVSTWDSFRIRLDVILNMHPRHGGIEIHKQSTSEKPKVFTDLDGAFFVKMIKIISYLELEKQA